LLTRAIHPILQDSKTINHYRCSNFQKEISFRLRLVESPWESGKTRNSRKHLLPQEKNNKAKYFRWKIMFVYRKAKLKKKNMMSQTWDFCWNCKSVCKTRSFLFVWSQALYGHNDHRCFFWMCVSSWSFPFFDSKAEISQQEYLTELMRFSCSFDCHVFFTHSFHFLNEKVARRPLNE
jgi:hypothetical protein